jgi:KDO2-lipid IV(A) lauroyltransferase
MMVLGVGINVIYRKSNNTLFEEKVFQKLKKGSMVKLIAKQDNAGIKMVKALKNGEIVALFVDQLDRSRGILSKFFGRKTYTNTTAFSLYKKLNIDLYYIYFLRRKNFFKMDFFCEKLNFDKENIAEIEFVNNINKKLENSIRQKPSQWFWVHNRWRQSEEE